jgi:hypothetical protein
MRAATSSPRLTLERAISIWRMRLCGLCQHDIAAALRLNQGRSAKC